MSDLMSMGCDKDEFIGDCPNIEKEVIDYDSLWDNLWEVKGWRLQKHIFNGNIRIIDDKNICKGKGNLEVMHEKMRRLTSESFLEPGDIVGISRGLLVDLYEHYAVYIGDNKVIHYCGEGDDFNGKITIHESLFNDFLKDSEDYFIVYFGENGMPNKIHHSTNFMFNGPFEIYEKDFLKGNSTVYSPEDTINRAKSRLGEEKYDLVKNNCEHFVMWCKTGKSISSQVRYIKNSLNI